MEKLKILVVASLCVRRLTDDWRSMCFELVLVHSLKTLVTHPRFHFKSINGDLFHISRIHSFVYEHELYVVLESEKQQVTDDDHTLKPNRPSAECVKSNGLQVEFYGIFSYIYKIFSAVNVLRASKASTKSD